ncbi:MAG TPA: RsmE family RNA methyltransferase [Verrucomicrobiota bacterium]|nr:RsmE family RNA methyltransferase [Verrucomicrobiota bacterium]
MHRFHLPAEQCRGATLTLTGDEAHHAARVLRVQPGERVLVLDGAGTQFVCRVATVARDSVHLAVVEKSFSPERECRITLLQSVPKGKIIESIIQKATELGVSRIVPILSERVVTHLDDEDGQRKADKWQQVAIEAIKQCGALWLPRVETPVTPGQFIARNEFFNLPLVASLQNDARHPREYFSNFNAQHGRRPESACVWVGPEGDFTPAEMEAIKSSGALPITLGLLVLRVETAATYCLSVLNYELSAPVTVP